MVCRMISIATSLTLPRSISHMFGNWLANHSKKIRQLIWVGVDALLLFAGSFGGVIMMLFLKNQD
jgi:hypothetical protein